MTIDVDAAKTRFLAFQQAMYAWETHFFPLVSTGDPAHAADAKAALRPIFDEYVYAYREDYGRMSGPDVSSPPDHDPDNDIIERVEAGRKKVTIYVSKTTQFQDRFRFTLAEHDGRWMIERTEIYWTSKEKWGVYHL
jgi:hypothetical protein